VVGYTGLGDQDPKNRGQRSRSRFSRSKIYFDPPPTFFQQFSKILSKNTWGYEGDFFKKFSKITLKCEN
jgi:hypothetical protein